MKLGDLKNSNLDFNWISVEDIRNKNGLSFSTLFIVKPKSSNNYYVAILVKVPRLGLTTYTRYDYYYKLVSENCRQKYYINCDTLQECYRLTYRNLGYLELVLEKLYKKNCKFIDFKDFEKVLVRNNDSEEWQPGLYKGYHILKGKKIHTTIDGKDYAECIKYSEVLSHKSGKIYGEELVGVSKNLDASENELRLIYKINEEYYFDGQVIKKFDDSNKLYFQTKKDLDSFSNDYLSRYIKLDYTHYAPSNFNSFQTYMQESYII